MHNPSQEFCPAKKQLCQKNHTFACIMEGWFNNKIKLLKIIIRWFSHKVTFHTDIPKNAQVWFTYWKIWCLERYILQDELDPANITEE